MRPTPSAYPTRGDRITEVVESPWTLTLLLPAVRVVSRSPTANPTAPPTVSPSISAKSSASRGIMCTEGGADIRALKLVRFCDRSPLLVAVVV